MALFGALIGVLVIFFLEWLEQDVIRSASDVERVLGGAVLGVIPPLSGEAASPAGEKRRQLVPRLRGSN